MRGTRMSRGRRSVWLFATVGAISFIAALVPVFKGGAPSAVFLGSGIVFLIVAIASGKKARARSGDPPAASVRR